MSEKETPTVKSETETPTAKTEKETPSPPSAEEILKAKISTTKTEIPITGKDKLIARLNNLLISELAAINQYTLHAGAIDYGGYKTLYESIDKGAKDEMKNAQQIISRILKLGGIPAIESVKGINYGKSVDEQLLNDLFLQKNKIKEYLDIINLSKEQEDTETTRLLESIMIEQVKYQVWIELQIEMIKKKEMVSFIEEQRA